MNKEKSCFDCKFYDGEQYCCMYKCETRCILNEWVAAENCLNFIKGEYDAVKLDRENYQ